MEATSTPQSVETWILDTLAAQSGNRDLASRDVKIADLDIDSLDLMEIWQMLDEELGVLVDPMEMREAQTIGEVLDLINKRPS
jgi:acyl carrier protein